ncbi:MAG: carbohydrate ABC transporter permease [Christensenellales bacterium]
MRILHRRKPQFDSSVLSRQLRFRTRRLRLIGFENFARFFREWSSSAQLGIGQKRAYRTRVQPWLGIPLALMFSYYIYKRRPMSTLFKIVLFMPSIVSTVVIVNNFRYFVELAIPEFAKAVFKVEMKGMLENAATRFSTIIFYNLWIGFGTPILMYVGAMNSISAAISEAAQIEGASKMQEFWYITLPLTYPTIVTFVIVNIAGAFNNQLNLYTFYGGYAPSLVQTFGYIIYSKTQAATYADYPYLAAMGLLMTVIVVPITLGIKWALERFGPSSD